MRTSFLTRAILIGGLLTAAEAISKDFESYGPGPRDIKSEWIRFATVGLMFSPSQGIAMGLDVENRSESPIWVKLIVGTPGSGILCEQVRALAPQQSATITCPRDTIQPDTDYPMTVEIFRDSALTSTAEKNSSQLRFHKKDLEELNGLKSASELPRVFKDVVYKSKLGATTALFGQLGPPNEGTLTVSADGIEWKAKRHTVTIPAAQIRAVRSDKLGPRATDVWVVVEYDEGGLAKLMALQTSTFHGAGPEAIPLIYTSIKALLDRR